MNRPSRRLRESATTTLKKGRFLAPPRASLMTTIALFPAKVKKDVDYKMKTTPLATIDGWPSTQPRESAFEPPKHPLHAALGDHFHHLLSLLELRKQPIDFLHGNARPCRDPALARGFEQLGPHP